MLVYVNSVSYQYNLEHLKFLFNQVIYSFFCCLRFNTRFHLDKLLLFYMLIKAPMFLFILFVVSSFNGSCLYLSAK